MKRFFFHIIKSNLIRILSIKIFILMFSHNVLAQDSPKKEINYIIDSLNKFSNHLSIEKVYIQTDKPYYFIGDTLWLKVYLTEASYFNASAKRSKITVKNK